MRRQFSTARRADLEGSQRSAELASALAQTCDPDLLERFLQLKLILDSIGGQVYFAAYRNKYDLATGELIADPKQPGRYETDGYLFHYEHIAKINRQAAEPDAKTEEPLPNPVDGLAGFDEEIDAAAAEAELAESVE